MRKIESNLLSLNDDSWHTIFLEKDVYKKTKRKKSHDTQRRLRRIPVTYIWYNICQNDAFQVWKRINKWLKSPESQSTNDWLSGLLVVRCWKRNECFCTNKTTVLSVCSWSYWFVSDLNVIINDQKFCVSVSISSGIQFNEGLLRILAAVPFIRNKIQQR